MHPRERAEAGAYIFEMASGYFGWTRGGDRRADAIEIKFGQGAKPGLGGLLPGPEGHRGDRRGPGAAGRRRRPLAVAGSATSTPSPTSRGGIAGDPGDQPAAPRRDQVRGRQRRGRRSPPPSRPAPTGSRSTGSGGGTGAAPVHVKDHVGIPGVRRPVPGPEVARRPRRRRRAAGRHRRVPHARRDGQGAGARAPTPSRWPPRRCWPSAASSTGPATGAPARSGIATQEAGAAPAARPRDLGRAAHDLPHRRHAA